jgi:hypothetical protein
VKSLTTFFLLLGERARVRASVLVKLKFAAQIRIRWKMDLCIPLTIAPTEQEKRILAHE